MKRYITLIILFFSLSYSFAQTPMEKELGSWFTLFGNHKISDKVSFSALIQAWDYEVADNFNFILYNIGANYHISPKVTATLAYGYADIDSGFNKSGPHNYENRISEQIVFKHKLSKLPIDHRFRLEQRILSKNNTFHNRIRYRIGTKINLNKTFFVRIHNEYITTIKTKEVDGFSENRLYSALGIKISKSVNIQTGYLYRRIKGLDLHRLQLSLFYKTDFRKKS